jgi:hypothetical protein
MAEMIALLSSFPAQAEPLETTGYMLLGYAFLIGLPLLYILSWVVQRRNLERDVELLRSLSQEAERPAGAPEAAAARPPLEQRPAE